MAIEYTLVSKADGSQTVDSQKDALLCVGVPKKRIHGNQVGESTLCQSGNGRRRFGGQ